MPRVVAFEDAKAQQFRLRDCATNTPFLKSSKDTPDLPVAFISRGDLKRTVAPHWHRVDQFQIVAEGKGKLGRHEVFPYCVHFTRAYTPYGPIVDDGKNAISFFTLRTRFDPGARYLPETKSELQQIPDRRPWQISAAVKFASPGSGGVAMQEIPGVKDEQGLFACSLSMAADARTAAPDPSQGDGQYLIVVKGSLWHNQKEHKSYTVVFVEPGEGPYQLHAGAAGLEAIVLNFPRTTARAAGKSMSGTSTGLKKWQCELCAFAYDEALGMPHDGIPAGTRWADVPEDWTCPDCATTKSDFRMVEVQ
jgi:rubredoxin